MIDISILTSRTPYIRGFNDFYPLLKWKKEFAEQGIKFHFFDSHTSIKLLKNEILIIDHRYFNDLKNKKKHTTRQYIIDFIEKAKKAGAKVILFDTGDGTGSRCFDLTEYVDLHLKKQLLKDLKKYTINKKDHSYMVWLPDGITKSNVPYVECPVDQITKLKLGWNIALVDYRLFPLEQYYPIGTSNLFNRLLPTPKFITPSLSRELLTSYRGSINSDNRYSYQRKILIKTFNEIRDAKIGKGPPLSKRKYYKELSQTKITVSPFGWGEICYRDFEAIKYGSLLLKPSLEHLSTFPNLFIKNKTYIPLKWDMSDLKEKLFSIRNNDYMKIASNAQNSFKAIINDHEQFISHFKKVLTYL